LKNSRSKKTSTNLGIENVYASPTNRLQGILTRSNFCGFLRGGFFNCNACDHQLRFKFREFEPTIIESSLLATI
jgi:hypothetical protein